MSGCFEVVIALAAPVAYQSRRPLFPLTFDALLGALAAYREGRIDPPAAKEIRDLKLPLEEGGREKRFYLASAVYFDRPALVRSFNWTRMGDWTDAAYRCAKTGRGGKNPLAEDPNPASGAFRRWRNSLLVVSAPYCRFWFRGDRAAVEDLLAGLSHVGARRAAGFGKVADVAVRPCPHDLTTTSPQGFAMRPLPVDEAPEGAKGMAAWAAYRPPYWDPANAALCYLPPAEWWLPLEEPLPPPQTAGAGKSPGNQEPAEETEDEEAV
jgi:CRISPR type IV-associated protein Csf3